MPVEVDCGLPEDIGDEIQLKELQLKEAIVDAFEDVPEDVLEKVRNEVLEDIRKCSRKYHSRKYFKKYPLRRRLRDNSRMHYGEERRKCPRKWL